MPQRLLPNHKNRKLQLIKINQWGVSLYTPQEEKNKMDEKYLETIKKEYGEAVMVAFKKSKFWNFEDYKQEQMDLLNKEEKNKMKLEEAKNIIKESVIDTQQAVKKLMEVQFEIFYNDFKRQLEEKQSQYDALRKMRNDFLDVENWEQLQEKIKEWNI